MVSSTARIARTVTAASIALALAWLALPTAEAQETPGTAPPSGTAGAPEPPVVAQVLPGLPGIDVSHWNGTIDWDQVAASGKRFAFAKATDGSDYVDPTYATNKAGATANGVVFGAYHFARPDDARRDAVREADHFVENADLGPGDLVPVLDIERTGGLTQAQVTKWILKWLDRVTERLGVRPMVYTSPYGWAQRTGDTTAVAAAGYTVLWVAHWEVPSPTLPAEDWSGNGWTFWQHTDCGTVAGIDGCVDLDRFAGAAFDAVTIPTPDTTPPTVSLTSPEAGAQTVTLAFSEIVRRVTPENTVLFRTDASAAEDVSITCRSGKGVIVDCREGKVRVALVRALDPLVAGVTYHAAVNVAGALEPVVDRSGNPATSTVFDVATPTELEQDSPLVSYGWRSVSEPGARGGSYVTERRASATASFGFSGPSVTWVTMTGPAQGRAAVFIDGRWVGTFDQYSRRHVLGVERRFADLGPGRHTLEVRVLGKRSAAASDTLVAIDAFEVGGDRVPTPELELSWGTTRDARASGRGFVASDAKGAALELTFRGTGVEWATVRGPRQGRAAIYVDGALVRTVDNFARETTFGVARTVSGLPEGDHALRIVVLGEARPAAGDTLVSVDGFSVIP